MAITRLREKYDSDVKKKMIEKFGYGNVHQVPKLDKVVINMSVGEAIQNSKILDVAMKELEAISGQKPIIKSFDGRGNYNLGLREQIVFPEINFDRVDKMRGMDIVIVTTAKTDEEATEFLTQMGLPLQKERAANG